jgi:hypothetical protein
VKPTVLWRTGHVTVTGEIRTEHGILLESVLLGDQNREGLVNTIINVRVHIKQVISRAFTNAWKVT